MKNDKNYLIIYTYMWEYIEMKNARFLGMISILGILADVRPSLERCKLLKKF